MADSVVWVGVFTGATAVLASWVTTLGNARAAKVQAEASAQVQRRDRVRETRRAAYLELMEQAHITGQLYWRVGDAFVQLVDPAERLTRIQELRTELRGAFDPLMRCVRVIVLEGPAPAAEAAEALMAAAAGGEQCAGAGCGGGGRRSGIPRALRRGRRCVPGQAGTVHRGSSYCHGRLVAVRGESPARSVG
ncbi:hypothetical protein OG742_29965 [Streptomyces sp. NBC_00828]|uniref:hypothetical protein n=1 Tax=Streptomyces sp. NBC_00828 TaxID=2903678 RepID=UPI0038648615